MTGPGSGVPGSARVIRVVVIGAFALALLAACGSSSSSSSVSGVKGGSEVKAQAINTAGTNPFTSSVGKDHAGEPQRPRDAGGQRDGSADEPRSGGQRDED